MKPMDIYEGINKIADSTANLIKQGVEEFNFSVEEQFPTYSSLAVSINGKTYRLVGEFTLKE